MKITNTHKVDFNVYFSNSYHFSSLKPQCFYIFYVMKQYTALTSYNTAYIGLSEIKSLWYCR